MTLLQNQIEERTLIKCDLRQTIIMGLGRGGWEGGKEAIRQKRVLVSQQPKPSTGRGREGKGPVQL
eukprot:2157353-Rhodomonas_salina.1